MLAAVKTKNVWLVEAMSQDTAWAELNKLWLEDGSVKVLASDGSLEECYSLVCGDYQLINECGFIMRVPEAGKYVDSGGAEAFVDNNQQLVEAAEEVIESLDLNVEDLEAYKLGHVSAEELLEKLERVF